MTTSKGPWSYDAESGMVTTRDTTGDWTANSGPKGITVVCTVESLDGISNGHLIASAPDLLAVVKELEESSSYWSEYDVPLGIVDRIRAAIANAEGAQ